MVHRAHHAVSRIIGALLLCIPMFISLDAVSASTALGIEFVLLWIGGVAPWTVCRKTWPVWIAAAGSFISVFLYGRTSGGDPVAGWLDCDQRGIHQSGHRHGYQGGGHCRTRRDSGLGLDPTDLADGLVEILHFSPRFVYGGLAGLRMFTLLQEDWRALGLSQRSRGLVTVTPSPVPSPKRSDCWCSPSGVPPNLPPPWKRAASAPAPHVPKPASRV